VPAMLCLRLVSNLPLWIKIWTNTEVLNKIVLVQTEKVDGELRAEGC
jgi:hypothetical protein